MNTSPNEKKIFLNTDVEKALTSYLDAKGLHDKTRSKYMEFFRKFSNIHTELNQETLDEFLKYNDYSSARAMIKHLIRAISRWEFPLEIKGSVAKLDIPQRTGKRNKKTPLLMEFKELQYLIDNMKEDSLITERTKLAIQTQWWGGLRISELLGISLEDLELDNYNSEKEWQKIKVSSESAKYGKEGYCYVPTDLYKGIIRYLKKKSNMSHSFARELDSGGNIWGYGKTAYDKALRTYTRQILGRSYNTHSLRHGRGTDLIKKGLSIEKVKEILRHKDISSTQVYVHLVGSDVEESLK